MDKIDGMSSISIIPTVELINDAYALCELESLAIAYCNPVFIEWFSIKQLVNLLY